MAIEKIRQRADGRLFLKDRKGKDREVKADGMYGDGGGLYLQISRGGTARSWIFRFFSPAHKRERSMGLGPFSPRDVTLEKARDLAAEKREQLRNGIDPIKARDDKQENDELAKFKDKTFRQVAEEWYAEYLKTWKIGRQEIIKSRLNKYVYPIIGDLAVQRLCTATYDDAESIIARVLKQDTANFHHPDNPVLPFWEQHPAQSEELLHDLHRIMLFAWGHGYVRKGECLATDMEGKLNQLLVPHEKFYRSTPHPALHWKLIGKFMADLRAHRDQTGRTPGRGGSIEPERRVISAMAYEFLILTGVRKNQVCEARWDEFEDLEDLNEAYWKCDKHKTDSSGEPYEVFLNTQALAVLEKMKAIRVNDYVFPGGRSGRKGHLRKGSIDSFQKNRMGRKDFTRHGMRTAIQSFGQSQKPPFTRVVLEKILNHRQPGLMEIYARHTDVEPEIRRLMQAWGNHCDRTAPLPAAKVLTMERVAAKR
jgi:integrase